jgi:alpha-ketoglutarate-dependent taurine dioxygenase
MLPSPRAPQVGHPVEWKPRGVLIRPLPSPFGAEVVGVDLRDQLSEPLKQSLVEAWHDHALLLFRDQDLTEGEQLGAGTIFGEIDTVGRDAESGFNYVSNVAKNGLTPYGDLGFQTTTHSCASRPPA